MTGILQMLLAAKGPPASYQVIQEFKFTADWTCPTGVTEVDYLVVAGGGGGGRDYAGGGGAGGYRAA